MHTDEELMNELEKRFGNECGYDIALKIAIHAYEG